MATRIAENIPTKIIGIAPKTEKRCPAPNLPLDMAYKKST